MHVGKKLSVGFGGGGVIVFNFGSLKCNIARFMLKSNLLSQYQCVFFLP